MRRPRTLRPLVAAILLASFPLTGCGGGSSGGSSGARFVMETVASGLDAPTAMAFSPDGRLFVCEKGGRLRVVKQGQLLAAPALSLSVSQDSERGLLGIAFDPAFPQNGRVYLYYTTGPGAANAPPTPKNRISRFIVTGDAAAAGSEAILLDGIPSDMGNHNGGCVRFGPDGKLYASAGDAGISTHAQDLGSLAGKILRLNADGTIPPDNPFLGHAGARPEIDCYGLRNPYRFAFQPGSGALFIADVGQDTWEEVDLGAPGANYGWPQTEGPTNLAGVVAPIYAYNHNGSSAAIIGGAFPSDPAYPSGYRGFFFADYVRNKVWRLLLNADNSAQSAIEFGPAEGIAQPVNGPVDLEAGPDGDLYSVNIGDGTVRRYRAQ